MTTSRRADSDEPEGGPSEPEAAAAVVLPIEDALDLHAFAPRDVADLVQEYLAECSRRGWREVRVIHGRGTGAQRAAVRSVLAAHPLVEAFADAPPERGGWGATIVQLRVPPLVTRDDE